MKARKSLHSALASTVTAYGPAPSSPTPSDVMSLDPLALPL